jgi:dihydrofolate reductase
VVRRRRALRPDGRARRGGGRDALLGLTQYYTATTLDGFIADEQDSLDWLFTRARDEDGPLSYERFYEGVGAVAMGSTTYEWILDHAKEWPYADVPSWVFSSRELRPVEGADLRFVRGDVAPVHAELAAAAGGKNVWIVGGGPLVAQFAEAGLLDEVLVTIAPVTLGAGRALLPARVELRLEETGRNGDFVAARYSVVREG